jgi:hypothetical protein
MTEDRRASLRIKRSQDEAALMDGVLETWSRVAAENDWPDVLAALDKARSALLDRMRPEDRAVAEAA